MLNFDVTKAVELFLVSVSDKAKRIEETKRGLGTKLILDCWGSRSVLRQLAWYRGRVTASDTFEHGHLQAAREVVLAACLAGAKAEAEAKREAMMANFMVDEETILFGNRDCENGNSRIGGSVDGKRGSCASSQCFEVSSASPRFNMLACPTRVQDPEAMSVSALVMM